LFVSKASSDQEKGSDYNQRDTKDFQDVITIKCSFSKKRKLHRHHHNTEEKNQERQPKFEPGEYSFE